MKIRNLKGMLLIGALGFSLYACVTSGTLSSIVTPTSNTAPGQGSELNQINQQIAATQSRINQLNSDRQLAQAQRAESLSGMAKITGMGPKIPTGEFGEDTHIDPGMLVVMHSNNITAASEFISKIDAELPSAYTQLGNLKAERAKLEAIAKSSQPPPATDGDGCFTPDTRVAVPGGTLAITSMTKGQVVATFDEQSQVVDHRPVLNVFRFKQNHYFILNSDIRVAARHRFMTDAGWVRVKDLKVGDRLRTRDGWKTLDRIDLVPARIDVVTLEVADHHDFFVLLGDDHYLVHNSGGGGK